MRIPALTFLFAIAFGSLSFAGVSVSTPANNSDVGTTVQFVAEANTACFDGVAAVGIYTAPGELAYSTPGSSLNTSLTLNPGTYNTVVQEWDKCGGSSKTPITIHVSGSGTGSSVKVSSPANNSSVSTTVQYVASATSSCAKGVAAMGIYTAPGLLAYSVSGAQLNTSIQLAAGVYNTVVQEWDNCGGAAKTPIAITVAGGSSTSGSFPNLQNQVGWDGYGLLPPAYDICTSCQPSGPQVSWSMIQGVTSPSLTGHASLMKIGGDTVSPTCSGTII